MHGFTKMSESEIDSVSGGVAGYLGQWMTVRNLQGENLAIRTAAAYNVNNEINHIGLCNGEQVQVAGQPVRGTGPNNSVTSYAYVYAPKFGCYGYVDSYYLG